MQRRNRESGFTLLELTCALFVITVAGFGAIQLYSVGIGQIMVMREYDAASAVLRSEMETLRAQPFEAISDGMAFTAPVPEEVLHAPEASVAVAPGPVAGLKDVTVRLRWQSRYGRWITRSLTTRIADRGAGGAP